MSFGNNVSADNSAINMAEAVNSPNRMVGIKFDMIKIEKPNTMVTEV